MSHTRLSQDEYLALQEVPILQATKQRGLLIPVLGAGMSVPIGLPSWYELAQVMAKTTPDKPSQLESMTAALSTAKHKLPESRYVQLIQDNLDTPENKTSLAHQALVSAGAKRIITTNLDFSIERAFEMAGSPLRPENVLRGPTTTRSAIRSGTVLQKIHGSLEDPTSWILLPDEYEKAYVHPGEVARWWQDIAEPLLFMGFSFSDEDIGQALRFLEKRRRVGSYALLSLADIRQKQHRLRTLGVTPIAYLDTKQIPELIDEIFLGTAVKPVLESDVFNNTRELRVGASRVDVPVYMSSDDVKEVGRVLANAVEFAAPETSLDKRSRRQYGERGQFIGALKKWVSNSAAKQSSQAAGSRGDDADADKSLLLLRGILSYPDILFSQLLPGVISAPRINARILTSLWLHADSWLRSKLQSFALELLEKPFIAASGKAMDSAAIRGIAVVIADTMNAHPAMRMPPPTEEIPNIPGLRITKYLLTARQVESLRNATTTTRPIKPYTLKSPGDADQIVDLINSGYSSRGTWRLPYEKEWQAIYASSGTKWPWGDNDPERGVHAHLSYIGAGGPVAPNPLEVGTQVGDIVGGFPLRDLIGNVYEVVRKDDHSGLALAGGGWTTAYRNGGRPPTISTFEADHPRQDNIGLRLIFVPHKGAL